MDFVCDRMPPSAGELQNHETFAIFSDALESGISGKKDAKLEALKQAVAGDFFLTCEQAEKLLFTFCDHQEAKVSAIAHFLPQMATAADACRLMAQNLSIKEVKKFRRSSEELQ